MLGTVIVMPCHIAHGDNIKKVFTCDRLVSHDVSWIGVIDQEAEPCLIAS